jgi:hypothetical protein
VEDKTKVKIKPLFLFGKSPVFIRRDKLGFFNLKDDSELDSRTEEILYKLNLKIEPKLIIRKDDNLNNLDPDIDIYIVFSHTVTRFNNMVSLAKKGKPIIITSEESAIGEALDTYEYLSDFNNVFFASSFLEVNNKIRLLNLSSQLKNKNIAIFDSGEHSNIYSCWYKNPLIKGKFNTHYIDIEDFKNRYNKVNKKKADTLAQEWVDECEVNEPSIMDIAKSARLYIAMKDIIEDMKANIAYVLWCGQFNSMLDTKMCFAVSKLNDNGILTGCWRGENLLPMLVLNSISGKNVFFGEIHMYDKGILSIRHCAVSKKLANCKYTLRRWRDKKGTVTGYCRLPEGEVTIMNSGQGDRVVIFGARIIETKDIEGDNCRTTLWMEISDENIIKRFVGRELALVYGSYVEEAKDFAEMLGTKAVC